MGCPPGLGGSPKLQRRGRSRKQLSAQQGSFKSCCQAWGLSIPLQLAPQDPPYTHPCPRAFVFLQSPPKLNEVTSDANRENSAVESGSESSSQEATPEKGTLQSCCLVGEGAQ